MFSDALAFVCLFVCWNKTRKKILPLLCWEGSSPPGSDHTGEEAQTVSRNITPAGNVLSIDFFFFFWFWISTDSAPITAGRFTATHLARQVHQERTQVVCSKKVAQKCLVRRHSRNSCHMFVCIVVCACSRHALDFKMLWGLPQYALIRWYARQVSCISVLGQYARPSPCIALPRGC